MNKFVRFAGACIVLSTVAACSYMAGVDAGAERADAFTTTRVVESNETTKEMKKADGSEYTDGDFKVCLNEKAKTGDFHSSDQSSVTWMATGCPAFDAYVKHCKQDGRDNCNQEAWIIAEDAVRRAGY